MKLRLLFLAAALLLELVIFVFPITYEREAPTMGTTVRVKLRAAGAPFLVNQAISEIKRLDDLLSNFKEQSEIGLINRLAGKAPLEVSVETFKMIALAVEMNRLSRGAFDVTLGHPEDLIIKDRKIYIKKPGVRIDPGGIGKGYAVEAARRLLLKRGVKSGIIDMNSSIAVIGDGWRIGIKDPREKEKLLGMVVLRDGEALSTSAQYEQPGHIVDPRTGKKADRCLSVTIIARDAAPADALSTAVFVLGPDEGMKLAKSLGVKAVIVDRLGIIYDNFGFKLR